MQVLWHDVETSVWCVLLTNIIDWMPPLKQFNYQDLQTCVFQLLSCVSKMWWLLYIAACFALRLKSLKEMLSYFAASSYNSQPSCVYSWNCNKHIQIHMYTHLCFRSPQHQLMWLFLQTFDCSLVWWLNDFQSLLKLRWLSCISQTVRCVSCPELMLAILVAIVSSQLSGSIKSM